MAVPAAQAAAPAAATMEWVIGELRATRTAVNEVRKAVEARLVQNASSPQFNQYLVQIMATYPGALEMSLRQLAGLLLKQNVEKHFATWPADAQAYLKAQVLAAVGHDDRHIRRTVGSVITAIVSRVRLKGWVELLPALSTKLDPGASEAAMDGSLQACAILCEDFPDDMISPELGHPLNTLLPKFMLFFKHPKPAFKRLALKCCINFIIEMPPAMVANSAAYLAGLSALTTDADAGVRALVCNSIVALTAERMDLLMPHITPILAFFLHSMSDIDDRVQLAACEFWDNFLVYAGDHVMLLREHFDKLIPVLLKCMVYSDDELADLPTEDVADEGEADRKEDVAPFIYRSHRGGDDDDGGGDSVSQWTLRRCAAYTLDGLARHFGHVVLPFILGELNSRFGTDDDALWLDKEAGILAFGAIVKGCESAFEPIFPKLYPHLLLLLDHKRPLIRNITCWSMSRIAPWIVAQPDDKTYTHAFLGKLCSHMLDHNKKVQEASCSAFATLVEAGAHKMSPFVAPILDTICAAFEKYQARNTFVLYDALGTFCDCMGPEVLNLPAYTAKLLSPLHKVWNALMDDDRQLLPLLECMTSVARALGPGFMPTAPAVYTRCLRLMESNLIVIKAAEDAGEPLPTDDDEVRDFIVLSLDMLSAMCEALGKGVAALMGKSNVLTLVHACMADSNDSVRQSACAVIGDVAKVCPELLVPALKDILGMLVANLREESEYVCNNASWAVGELAIRAREHMQPYAAHIVPRLAAIVANHRNEQQLLENVTISIGRLALGCPAQVAPLAGTFAAAWVPQLRHIGDPEEKTHAFQGLFELLKVDPAPIAPHFSALCDGIVSWGPEPPAAMATMFRQVVAAFKSMAGEGWAAVAATLDPGTRAAMTSHYGLTA